MNAISERVSYYDDKWDVREAEVLERKPYFVLVKDIETGEQFWKCNFEIV